ncbi:MAG: NUDIX domain-containing protein [Thermoplasmata archaeon]
MTGRHPRIAQECVEGYLFVRRPFQVLLFRRPPSRGRIWVPISGKVDPSDRNLSTALRREIEEETGLTRLRHVAPMRWVFRWRGSDGGVWRLHAFAVELPSRRTPRLSDEHDAFEWLEPSVAVTRLHYRDNRAALRRLMRTARRRGPTRKG